MGRSRDKQSIAASGAGGAAGSAAAMDDSVDRELLRLVYGNYRTAVLMSFLAMVVVDTLFWGKVPHTRLLVLAVILLAALGFRLGSWRAFRRAAPYADLRPAQRNLVLGQSLTGAFWGATSVLLFLPDLVSHQMWLALLLGGLAAGSLVVASAHLPAYYAFLFPSMLPMIGVLTVQGSLVAVTAALGLSIYTGALVVLARSNNRSLREVIGLRMQVAAERDRAERANIAKSKFLAAASHDLRQPLHALSLFTGALSERIRYPEVRRIVEHINESVAALQTLFDALLDISRLDAGIVRPQVVDFPLADMLQRLARDYERQAEAKGLRYVYVPTALVVRSDPALLERILRNFLSNAVRYTSSGRIIVGCRRSGRQVRLEVWDSGIGIPRSQQKTIFREFHQLGNPERDRNKGLGLGLAIVERLSRLLDHPVAVRSALGRYTCLGVTVPRGDPARVAPPNPRPPPDLTALSGQLVVVVDDESLVRAGMYELLTGWGCEVIAAPTAEAAIADLQQRDAAPDVIIADYRLGGGRTGADAVRDIVAACGRPVPSLIITGDTSAERLREVRASGLQLLHKPVQPAQLRTYLMRLKRARDASGSGYLAG